MNVDSVEWKGVLRSPWAVEVQNLVLFEPVEVQSSLNFEKIQRSPFEFLHPHASSIWGLRLHYFGYETKES